MAGGLGDAGPGRSSLRRVRRFHVAGCSVARTRAERVVLPVNPELGRPEHHEHRWVDLTEAFALTGARLKPIVAWAAGKVMLAAQLAK